MTADGYVTRAATTQGWVIIKALIAHGEGVAAGDKVVLREGSPTGTVMDIAVADGPNGQFGQAYPGDKVGVKIGLPVYYSEQKTSGTIRTQVVWE
jgi:hypothetical protein